MTAGRDGFIPPFQDLRTLSEHICVGESTIERWVREGKFPAPIWKAGKNLWRWKDVEHHLAGGASTDAASPDAERIREATRHALRQATGR